MLYCNKEPTLTTHLDRYLPNKNLRRYVMENFFVFLKKGQDVYFQFNLFLNNQPNLNEATLKNEKIRIASVNTINTIHHQQLFLNTSFTAAFSQTAIPITSTII
jgi:archaeosine-15-forming tRNA-guanine transglycosylase